jgi:hypothetical protein
MQLEKCEFTREPVKRYPREFKSILSCNSQLVAAKLVPQLNRWWKSFCLAPRNSTRHTKKRGGATQKILQCRIKTVERFIQDH